MIFTGVTGGEIISLLYPLFILSPFCYIIISKESLDGTSRGASVPGDSESAAAGRDGDLRIASGLGGSSDLLRNAGRGKRLCDPGGHFVLSVLRGTASGKDLRWNDRSGSSRQPASDLQSPVAV